MIISVNWLKKFTGIKGSVDELATLIGARLVEIESVEYIGDKYKDAVIVKVVECQPLEGTDHLNVAKIDDGGAVQGVERDSNGLVQVVCGAPNIREGLLVVWLPPNSVVPETANDAEPFVLQAKPLRGVVSNGMLASAKELDLYDDHTGILEIDQDVAPGASFAELYELNDYLLNIENKSLTHRPDAFGVIGFAREVAGIQGIPFQTPSWLEVLDGAVQNDGTLVAPTISIDDSSLSARFQAIVLSGVDEKVSAPVQLQTYLARSGVRPINAAVDVSNYLMLLTGQPSHTYDYDKLKAIAGNDFTVHVRRATEGETLILLDGKEAKLDTSDIVIAAGSTPVGLAGIMGGLSTAVDATTKNVLLEVATFDLYSMRSSQMRHGIFSEAVTRFTKGIPAALSTPVLVEAVRLLGEYTGARATSSVVDQYPGKAPFNTVKTNSKAINAVLGTEFTTDVVSKLLQNVGFAIQSSDEDIEVTAPYWRQDIHIGEDVIEEVGRLAGFDTIAIKMPKRDFEAIRPSDFDTFRSSVRTSLVRSGANEIVTYSFVHGDLFKKVGQSPDNAYKIVNSLSPDLQYYRQSLTPSLLSHVFANNKAGYGSFALFEANKVHQKADGTTDEKVPVERDSLAYVVVDTKKSGDAYYEAKRALEYLLDVRGINVSFVPIEQKDDASYTPFEPKRSALVVDSVSNQALGVVGEYTQAVRRGFKLPAYSAGFELDMRQLSKTAQDTSVSYQPLGRYQGTERDICFQVSSLTAYSTVAETARRVVDKTNLITVIEPLDIYEPEAGDTKNITIRVKLASYEKTMTSDEVGEVIDNITKAVIDETQGKVV